MTVGHLDLLYGMPRFDGAALCAEADPEAFFPEKGQSNRQAKKACGRCEIRAACLQWALDNGEAGIWGGTSERQRRQMRSRSPQRRAS